MEIVAAGNGMTVDATQSIDDSVAAIRRVWRGVPQVAVILGTGLGGIADEVEIEAEFPYADLPHFPRSTALAHRGRLLCGRLAGASAVVMDGRCHLYEGYSYSDVTFPVRVMRALGASTLIASNAAGGLNPRFDAGDVVVLNDHINLMFRGASVDRSCELEPVTIHRPAPRRPAYDERLAQLALAVARRAGFAAHLGTYVAVTGPNYETRAEYRMFRRIGADVVGMSTVPEVIVAAHCGLKAVGFSVVTDMCLPDALEAADVPKIIAVANGAEPKLRTLVGGVLDSDESRGL